MSVFNEKSLFHIFVASQNDTFAVFTFSSTYLWKIVGDLFLDRRSQDGDDFETLCAFASELEINDKLTVQQTWTLTAPLEICFK